MKQIEILLLPAALMLALLVSCTEVEPIDRRTLTPAEQDPALYAQYLEALNAYKSSEHFITYARMDNAPEVSTSPRDYLHAMPDSLDMIALRRPLSPFDLQDLPAVQAKGTKVLAWADCSEAATAAASVERALSQITTHGLDGLAIYSAGASPEASLLEKVAAIDGKTLIFEGDPSLIAAASREAFDYLILDATVFDNVYTLRQEVDYATLRLGIPEAKLLVAAAPTGTLDDTALHAQQALTLVARCVMSYGPLGGIAVYDIGSDYYDPSTNYRRTRQAIALLNPAYN